jgi:hypothetical protein
MSAKAFITKTLKSGASDRFPVPPPFVYDPDYKSFLKINSLTANVGTAVGWALSSVVHILVPGNSPPVDITVGTNKVMLSDPYPFSASDSDITPQLFDLIVDLLRNDLAKAGIYLLDLVGASQVSTLDEGNVQSYFASKGADFSVATVMKCLPYFCAVVEILYRDPDFINRVKDYEWLRYHTTYSSGTDLIVRVLESTNTTTANVGPYRVCASTYNAVMAAHAAPYDKVLSDRIPLALKGICHVHLEAIGLLPKNKWYQGLKGREILSPAAITAITTYAVRSTELQADKTAINSATTVAAAEAALINTGAVPST